MTDRKLAAAVDRSPFFTHESMQVPNDPNLANFWEFQRQFARAIFESLTPEECMTLTKVARILARIARQFTLDELMRFFAVSKAILGAYAQVDFENVKDATKAFNEGWRLMAKYRTTGEV